MYLSISIYMGIVLRSRNSNPMSATIRPRTQISNLPCILKTVTQVMKTFVLFQTNERFQKMHISLQQKRKNFFSLAFRASYLETTIIKDNGKPRARCKCHCVCLFDLWTLNSLLEPQVKQLNWIFLT